MKKYSEQSKRTIRTHMPVAVFPLFVMIACFHKRKISNPTCYKQISASYRHNLSATSDNYRDTKESCANNEPVKAHAQRSSRR
jgi:hypothetical protein